MDMKIGSKPTSNDVDHPSVTLATALHPSPVTKLLSSTGSKRTSKVVSISSTQLDSSKPLTATPPATIHTDGAFISRFAPDKAKAKGNTAFSAGKFGEAIHFFSKAINLTPSNHVLYSNSFSQTRLVQGLQPSRRCPLGLGDFDAAISAYKKGLELDPSNEALKSGLTDAQSAASRARSPRANSSSPASSIGNIFQGPDVWAKLTADPTTRGYLQQPDFLTMLSDVQRNPNNMNKYLTDQRMMQVLGVLLNVKLRTATPEEMERDVPMSETAPPEAKKRAKEPEPEPEPEPMEISEEEKEAKERKAAAQKEKEAGNAAYKKKDFETAIQHYTKATELDDEDISFLTNRAAVYLEMGKVRL